jgi:N-acetylneuraminate epimerase
MQASRSAWWFVWLAVLDASCLSVGSSAREPVADAADGHGTPIVLDWRRLSSLPDPVGVAGSFAGVSAGAVIVAGGANFPDRPPWEGGRKVWHDRLWMLADADAEWRPIGRLPRPLAYGVSATDRHGVICVGGSDERQHHADVVRIRLVGTEVRFDELPRLPEPLANGCGAVVGDTLYVCGGTVSPEATRPLDGLWSLDLTAADAAWRRLEPCPGGPRLLATAAALNDGLFICGGADLEPAAGGPPTRIYRRDAWLYAPDAGWKRLADAPCPLVAAPSPAPVLSTGEAVVLGGDTGEHVGFAPPDRHPGFSRMVLAYDPRHDSWRTLATAAVARVTVPVVQWRRQWLVVSGEARPGVRSPEVWAIRDEQEP